MKYNLFSYSEEKAIYLFNYLSKEIIQYAIGKILNVAFKWYHLHICSWSES